VSEIIGGVLIERDLDRISGRVGLDLLERELHRDAMRRRRVVRADELPEDQLSTFAGVLAGVGIGSVMYVVLALVLRYFLI
jgi:hypothetical protein